MAVTGIDKLRTKLVDLYHSSVAHVPTLFAYSLGLVLSIICIDQVEKIRFIAAAKSELQQNTISQEVFDGVKAAINGASAFDSILTIIAVILCFLIGRFILRRATGLNWSRTITLPAAVEFSSAMRKIGKLDFAEQMACIYEHNISVYIANDPILEDQAESVLVKLYPHVRNSFLVLEDILTKNIGKRQPCLNAADYDPIYQQYCQTAQAVAFAKITALEHENAALKDMLSLKEDDNKKLIEKNAILSTDNSDLNKKLKMVKPRKEKDEKGDFRKIPLWRVLIPLGDRLKVEAMPGITYTTTRIRDEFISELEKHPDLRDAVQKVLRGTTQESDDDEAKPEDAKVEDIKAKDVPDWVIKIIREDLQELARRKPGAPQKSKNIRGL